MLAQSEPSIFPHRKQCAWVDQGGGLSMRICSDGEILMWHDADTRETWLYNEQPPKKWQHYFRQKHLQHGGLGAAETAAVGVCPPHPHIAPRPSTTIHRLQAALRELGQRANDANLHIATDGLVGQHTVKAVNRAMYMYAKNGAPAEFATGGLTRAQVVAFAPQLTALVQRSPFPNTTTAAVTPPAPASAYAPASPGGASTMPPYYAPAPTYYGPPQPAYYAPRRGPGGLPTDRASVDIRTFIPAQYEHVRIDPGTVAAALGVLVVVVLLVDRKKSRKES